MWLPSWRVGSRRLEGLIKVLKKVLKLWLKFEENHGEVGHRRNRHNLNEGAQHFFSILFSYVPLKCLLFQQKNQLSVTSLVPHPPIDAKIYWLWLTVTGLKPFVSLHLTLCQAIHSAYQHATISFSPSHSVRQPMHCQSPAHRQIKYH